MGDATHTELILPVVEVAEHLIDYLFSIGPTTGGETISFQEIAAWTALTGYRLNGWEAETLRRLSGAYAAEHYAASDAKRPAPYSAPLTAANKPSRDDVAAKIKAAFGI